MWNSDPTRRQKPKILLISGKLDFTQHEGIDLALLELENGYLNKTTVKSPKQINAHL